MPASLQELERWKMEVEKNASILTKQAQVRQLSRNPEPLVGMIVWNCRASFGKPHSGMDARCHCVTMLAPRKEIEAQLERRQASLGKQLEVDGAEGSGVWTGRR